MIRWRSAILYLPVHPAVAAARDRKSTRLNSSHLVISYAVFCLKKKKTDTRLSFPAQQITTTTMRRPAIPTQSPLLDGLFLVQQNMRDRHDHDFANRLHIPSVVL